MISFLERQYNMSLDKVDNINNATYIYHKKFNLEILIRIESLVEYEKEVILMCGNYKKFNQFYKSNITQEFDVALCGMAKIRFLNFMQNRVKTFSKKIEFDNAREDANIRLKYKLLPAPKVLSISEDCVEEELVLNTNTKKYLLTHPKDALLALEKLIPAISKYIEQQEGRYISIVNGQLYKNDHVLIDKGKNIYLVDWSEGGKKNKDGKYYVYFDFISCIKWTIVARRYNFYYYCLYINNFVKLMKNIADNIQMEDWKKEATETIYLLCEDGHKFHKQSYLVQNLIRRIYEAK